MGISNTKLRTTGSVYFLLDLWLLLDFYNSTEQCWGWVVLVVCFFKFMLLFKEVATISLTTILIFNSHILAYQD